MTDATFLNKQIKDNQEIVQHYKHGQPGICQSHNFKGYIPAGNTSSAGAIAKLPFVLSGMVSSKTTLFFSVFMLFVLCRLTAQAVLGTKEIN